MSKRFTSILAIFSLAILAGFFIFLSFGGHVSADRVPSSSVQQPQATPTEGPPPAGEIDIEPPFDPPPPREWVMLEVEIVTPQDVNAGLRDKINMVVKVHNRGNIPAENVLVTLDGVAALEAPEERIREIKPGKHENVNLQVELFGRYSEPLTFAVRAEAGNSEIPVYDHGRMTFAPLDNAQYFDDDTNIQLKAERLPRNRYRTFHGDLLRFELLSGRPENDALEIDVSGLLNQAERDTGDLILIYKAARSRKSEVPLTFDKETAKVSTTLPGPGAYALQWRPAASVRNEEAGTMSITQVENDQDYIPSGWVPTYHAPTVAEFSGAVTYDYPLVVPPGPNGLQPSLSLSYSSSQGNGLMGDFQADTIGFGWTLTSRIDIVQSLYAGKDALQRDCGGNNACLSLIDLDLNQSTEDFYNQYTLSFQGQGHELIHENGRENNGQAGRYYAAGNAGLYVELCKANASNEWSDSCEHHKETGADPQESGQESRVFWFLKTPGNTTYRLGYTATSEQEIFDGHADVGVVNKALKWRVDTAIDRYGNEMTYNYIEDDYDWFQTWTTSKDTIHTPASYLESISYGDYKIAFKYESIPEDRYGRMDDVVSWQTYFVKAIEVKKQTQVLREYKLYHDWVRYGVGVGNDPVYLRQSPECAAFEYRLKENPLVEFVPDEVNMLAGISELVHVPQGSGIKQGRACTDETNCENNPDRTFEYTFELGGFADTSATEHFRFCAPYMTAFDTLYGPASSTEPTAEFEYSTGYAYEESDYRGDGQWPYYHVVEKQTVHSGWTDDAPDVETTYVYDSEDANFEGVADGFQGYSKVIRKEGPLPNGTWQRKTELNFEVQPYHENDSTLTGKLKTSKAFDAGGSEVLKDETTWHMLHEENHSGASNVNANSRHPVVTVHKSTDKRDGGSALTREVYKYDVYGNQTQVQEFGERTNGNPYRTLEMEYNPNADPNLDKWLVNLPWQVTLWEGLPETTRVWQKRYRYDGANCSIPHKKPVAGLIWFEDQYISGGGDNADIVRDGAGGYDCGNDWLTTNNYYGDEGQSGYGADWQLTKVLDPGGIEQNTKWLDGTRVASRDDAVGTTSFEYNDAYTPWLVTTVESVNGAKTSYEYDYFGRLLVVKSPNPSTGDADQITQSFIYHDTENPLYIDMYTPDPNTGGNMKERVFYDAVGRPLQKRVWNISSDFNQALTDTEYDALGRPTCAMVAWEATAHDFNAGLQCGNYGHTETSYDVFDDVIEIVEPGGQTTSTEYGNRQQEVTDANNNKTTYTNDPLGRLVSVQQPGVGGPAHTTTYAYDLADNLIEVNGANNALTTIDYDEAGRKIEMTDPNMGHWTYAYDASGNLSRQTDAESQRICFYYDNAGRLTDKRKNGSGTADCPEGINGAKLAQYTYYTSGDGKGQIEKIEYNDSSYYHDTFLYDLRGRVVETTRTIYGKSFTLETQYDNLDRPTTITLPNDEIITTTYDGQYPDTLTSNDASTGEVIRNLKYNHRGQLITTTRKINAPATWYVYYEASEGLGSQTYKRKYINHGSWKSGSLSDFKYDSSQYDGVGNIKQIKTLVDGEVEKQTFTYDALNRLATASGIDGPESADYNYTYSYGPGGNIATRNGTGGNRVYDYYDEFPNHKHALEKILVSGTPIASFAYDENGNMETRTVNGVTYTQDWDAENRLTSVTADGSATTTFVYDVDGQRVYTQLDDGTQIYTPFPGYEEVWLPGIQQTTVVRNNRLPKDTSQRQPKAVTGTNILQNPGFEDGKLPWKFSGNGTYVTAAPGYSGSKEGKVTITTNGDNQLYQYDLTLNANSDYRISFAGKSSDGSDVKFYLQQHGSPYTNYGLNNKLFNLTTNWQTFSFDFTTSGFSGTVNDGRLRLWFKNLANDGTIYYFDDVVLEEISGGGPTATPTNTPSSGDLVHHYALDESSGSTAYDSAGSRDGTLNGPTWQPTDGQIDGALRFDGTDDLVDLGAFDLSGSALTIAFWMKADDFGVTDARFISKATGVNEADHYWMVSTLNSTELRFRLKTNGTTATLSSASGTLSSGQWTHVAATYDGSNMRLYKNGQQVAAMAKSGSISSSAGTDVALGNQPAGAGDRAFDGLLDDVCIYERALSAAELTAIKDNGCGGTPTGTPTPTATNTPGPTATPTATPSGGGSTIDLFITGSTNEEVAQLLIDDQVVDTYTEMGTGWATGQYSQYTYQHGTSVTANQVKVRFINDGETSGGQDKNVRVGHIKIDGVTYQTEAPTTFSTGTWTSGSGCDDDFKQSELLGCNGYFWYQATVERIQRATYSLGGQTVGVREVNIEDNGTISIQWDELHYLYTDHLGSVVAVTDDSGDLVGDVIRYEPFGGYRGTVPDATNPSITDRGFTGHQENSYIKLIDMRARWYDPAVGRFISPDTIIPNPRNPQSFNRYSYVRNDPINLKDPTGHSECATYDCSLTWHPVNGNVVVRNASTPLYALIQRFSTSNGSAVSRLDQVLAETGSGIGGRNFKFMGQFEGIAGSKGDGGFQSNLGDDHLYGNLWNIDTPASKQVGHFLSAVAMGRDRGAEQWIWLYLIVRHEQFSDGRNGIGRAVGLARQAIPLGNYELATAVGDTWQFLEAVKHDATGNFAARDDLLQGILSPSYYGAQSGRVGNSMEDLRLSVRGWRMGNMTARGNFQSSQSIANWLALNVAGD